MSNNILKKRVIKHWGNICVYCKKVLQAPEVTIEHFVFHLSDYKCSQMWNLRPACGKCNNNRGALYIDIIQPKINSIRKRILLTLRLHEFYLIEYFSEWLDLLQTLRGDVVSYLLRIYP